MTEHLLGRVSNGLALSFSVGFLVTSIYILGLAAEEVFGTGLRLGMKQQLLILVDTLERYS